MIVPPKVSFRSPPPLKTNTSKTPTSGVVRACSLRKQKKHTHTKVSPSDSACGALSSSACAGKIRGFFRGRVLNYLPTCGQVPPMDGCASGRLMMGAISPFETSTLLSKLPSPSKSLATNSAATYQNNGRYRIRGVINKGVIK